MDVSHTHGFSCFPCTCLLVWLCLTLSHTWQQGVWCFRCRLQPGSRLLLLTVGSHIFAYPSAAVPSHAGLICLAILPNRSAVSAPEPPSSALPVSAPEPPAQSLSLLPPDNNAAETAHNQHREWRPIPGRFRFVLSVTSAESCPPVELDTVDGHVLVCLLDHGLYQRRLVTLQTSTSMPRIRCLSICFLATTLLPMSRQKMG